MEDLNSNYLLSLQQYNEPIETLRSFAETHQVPIIDRLSLDLVKQIIRLNGPKRILEIGTAIGYSAMHFASISKDIHVTTIERNETMIQYARENIDKYQYHQQIKLIEGDALEVFEQVNDGMYDMIFIDAAKAQSKKFFELYTPLLKQGGIVITDNILYHGFVANIDIVRSRNVRQMVKKVQQYNEWLAKQPEYTTNFVNLDDGLAISIKGE